MKNEVLCRYNNYNAYCDHGKSADNELSWMNQKLFLELAPEPNDIDW